MSSEYLKVKDYSMREEFQNNKKFYVLSFNLNHHVKVSEKAKLIIDYFDGRNSIEMIIEKLKNTQSLIISKSELEYFIDNFLIKNAMIIGIEYKIKKEPLLWIKIPLIESERLKIIFNHLKFLYNKNILVILLICIFNCILFSIFKLITIDINLHELDFTNLVLWGYFAMILHEFGHITAAYKYNTQVGKMGIGIFMFYPVMYVDVTNIWRLENKRRALVDFGGVYFQMLIIIPMTVCAFLTNKDYLYVINIYLFAATFYNLLPITKMDGYWFFSDYFGVDNISKNAFYVVRTVLKSFGKDKKHKILKDWNKSYIIYSFLYTLSLVSILGVGIFYSIQMILKRAYILKLSEKIYLNIINLDFNEAFINFNEIIVYILPVIFICIISIKIFLKFIKGVVVSDRTKKCCKDI